MFTFGWLEQKVVAVGFVHYGVFSCDGVIVDLLPYISLKKRWKKMMRGGNRVCQYVVAPGAIILDCSD